MHWLTRWTNGPASDYNSARRKGRLGSRETIAMGKRKQGGDKTAAGEKAPSGHPPGAAETGSGGSEESREAKSNQSDDNSGTGKGAKNTQPPKRSDAEEEDSRLRQVDKKHLADAHNVIKEGIADLKQVKKEETSESKLGGRRRMASGGLFSSLSVFFHGVLEKVAAAAHVVFTKENIPTLRAIIKAFPGDGPFEAMLLLALDQYERTLPADPNADLTVEALSR
jgi:hypothetical protein